MKNFTLLMTAFFFSLISFGQGNSQGKGNKGKSNGKGQAKQQQANPNYNNDVIWNGTNSNASAGKSSKNQPAKVRSSFYRDYPNASNVVWNKYRGDWTATFGNGPFRSTAVYHANGQRKDTRTAIQRQDLPGTTIWDRIFRRDGVTPTGEFVRIERPNTVGDIFRMAIQKATGQQQTYYYYNANGQLVKYDY
ncbi:MAG: hypothetical protein ABIW38_08915 [Ferruginibacter sp.]